MRHSDRLITTRASFREELLYFSFIFDTLLNYEVAPPDREEPANDVGGRQHLHNTNRELGLAPSTRVPDARHQHGAGARKDDVKNQADVGPGAAETRHSSHKIPQFSVLLSVLDHVGFRVVDTLLGELGCSIFVAS